MLPRHTTTLAFVLALLYCFSYQSTVAHENEVVHKTDDEKVHERKLYYERNWLNFYDGKLATISNNLRYAVGNGNTELVEKFMREENFTKSEKDNDKICLLARLSIVELGYVGMAEYLIRLGFNIKLSEVPEDPPRCFESLLNDLERAREALKKLDDNDNIYEGEDGETMMHKVAKDEDWFIVDVLINRLMDDNKPIRNVIDKDGLSIFHLLSAGMYDDIVQRFLKQKTGDPRFDVNAAVSLDSTFRPGFTALHFAFERCRLNTVVVLTSNEASLKIKDSFGKTPIQVICKYMRPHQQIGRRYETDGGSVIFPQGFVPTENDSHDEA